MIADYSLIVVVMMAALLTMPVSSKAMEMEECFGCHEDADVVGGDLVIAADPFQHTVHGELGCVTCHETVTDEHPDNGVAVTAANCSECHEEVSEQYRQNAHAENAVCTDCHNPHKAFGLENTSSRFMNRQCSQCHETDEVVETHSSWLPQATLHLAKLPCIVCHTSSEGYEIVLHVTQKKENGGISDFAISTYDDLRAFSDKGDSGRLIDINKDNFISLAELRTFNLNPAFKALRLEGTLVPDEVSHELTTLDNRYDCSFCHASGPGSMQTSFLSLPRENGSFVRIDVEKGAVLDALYGTPDFYMTGSTRSASLNIIGLIIICGGFIMPIGHGTLRFLTRKNRQEKGE